MSLPKYNAQHISQDTGQPNGARRMLFGPESVYLAKDADAELARYKRAVEFLSSCLDIETATWRECHLIPTDLRDIIKAQP